MRSLACPLMTLKGSKNRTILLMNVKGSDWNSFEVYWTYSAPLNHKA